MKKLIIILASLFCAALASQFPEYVQQYQQRLSGAVTELTQVVEQFDLDARNNDLTRKQALDRYEASQDEFLKDRADRISTLIQRYDRLRLHLRSLETAAPFQKLGLFIKDRDIEMASDTAKIYQPAIPLTTMGAAHAAGGFGLGWVLFSILLWPFRGARHRRAVPAQR